VARKKLSDYDWQESFTEESWLLQINNTHAFEVKHLGDEKFSFTVVDSLGSHGKVLSDCCCNCAKWKCIGYLERNEWRLLAPQQGEKDGT